MESGIRFDAPWGLSLKLITPISVGILLAVPVFGLLSGSRDNMAWITGMVVVPLLVLVVAAFFVIRGYRLAGNALLVQRLGWRSALNLENLLSVAVDPDAMKGSIRLFGNGGLFCFAGKFRNRKLGTYRALATAPRLAVVLRFTDRILVVTPGDPGEFARTLERWLDDRDKSTGRQRRNRGEPPAPGD